MVMIVCKSANGGGVLLLEPHLIKGERSASIGTGEGAGGGGRERTCSPAEAAGLGGLPPLPSVVLFFGYVSQGLSGALDSRAAREARTVASSVSLSQRLVHHGWEPVHGRQGQALQARRHSFGRHGSSAAVGSVRRGGGGR